MNDGRCDQSPIRQTGLVPRRLAGCQPRLINTRSLLDRRLLFLRKWSHSSGHFLRPVGPQAPPTGKRAHRLLAGKFAKFSAKMSSNAPRTMGVICRQRKALNTWRARIAYHGSADAAASRATSREPSPAQRPGCSSPRHDYSREGAQEPSKHSDNYQSDSQELRPARRLSGLSQASSARDVRRRCSFLPVPATSASDRKCSLLNLFQKLETNSFSAAVLR